MITFDFDALELSRQMQRMGEELHIAGPKIVRVEAHALLKQVIRETSPDSKKQGRLAVKMDITRAVTPLDPARFTHSRIADYIREHDVPALNAVMQNAKNRWKTWTVVEYFDPDTQHKGVRNRRGRVPKFKRKFTADIRFWNRYVRMEQAQVGSAKASWAIGYREVGGTLPDWIASHHAEGYSTVISYVNDPVNPSITVSSSAHGVVNDEELKRSISRAMQIRGRAMVNKTKRMLSDPLKYAKLFDQYK